MHEVNFFKGPVFTAAVFNMKLDNSLPMTVIHFSLSPFPYPLTPFWVSLWPVSNILGFFPEENGICWHGPICCQGQRQVQDLILPSRRGGHPQKLPVVLAVGAELASMCRRHWQCGQPCQGGTSSSRRCHQWHGLVGGAHAPHMPFVHITYFLILTWQSVLWQLECLLFTGLSRKARASRQEPLGF